MPAALEKYTPKSVAPVFNYAFPGEILSVVIEGLKIPQVILVCCDSADECAEVFEIPKTEYSELFTGDDVMDNFCNEENLIQKLQASEIELDLSNVINGAWLRVTHIMSMRNN